MRTSSTLAALIAASSVILLAGCGGGSGGGNSGPTSISESLSSSDTTLSDGRIVDFYNFTAREDGTGEVAMASNAVDSQLLIGVRNSDGTYTAIAGNDDDPSGSTLNSRTTFSITRGDQYVAVATSHNSGETGSYTIVFSDTLNNVHRTDSFPNFQSSLARSLAKAAKPDH